MAFKSTDDVETRRVLLTLDDGTIEVFRKVGEGNVSLGARNVARQFLEMKAEGVPRRQTTSRAAAKEDGETDEQRQRRLFMKECKALMAKERLSYRTGHWYRDDARVSSVGAVTRLLREHPSFVRYAKLVDEGN